MISLSPSLKNNDLNPIWNEHYEFIVEDQMTQYLFVKVYDDEGIQKSELIGCVRVPLNNLVPGKVKDSWFGLVKDLDYQRDKKFRGEVDVLLTFLIWSYSSVDFDFDLICNRCIWSFSTVQIIWKMRSQTHSLQKCSQ